MLRPARGDSRPCTLAGCPGTMQFCRESDNDARRAPGTVPLAPASAAAHDRMGWSCTSSVDHFRTGD
jgi:hypothetical protein